MSEPLITTPDSTEGDEDKGLDLQPTMQEAMDKLEVRNGELGGGLFGVFGGKTPSSFSTEGQRFSTRCFIFKTPITKEASSADEVDVDEFLVVTEEAFALILINKGASLGEGQRLFKDVLVGHIEYAQTHQQQPDEKNKLAIDYRVDSGYTRRDGIVLPPSPDLVKLGVLYGKNLIGWEGTVLSGQALPSVKLVDLTAQDINTVLEIIQVNIERVGQEGAEEASGEEEKRERQIKIAEILNRVDPSLTAAQRLNEVLG